MHPATATQVSHLSIYQDHKQEKKREYGDQVWEVEQATFTLLVFAATGGMGKGATVVYHWLADLLSHKNNVTYHITLARLRCILSFSLLRSSTVCIRGSRFISYQSSDVSSEFIGLATGLRDCKVFMHSFKQLSSTWHFCAEGGGKGIPSCPG